MNTNEPNNGEQAKMDPERSAQDQQHDGTSNQGVSERIDMQGQTEHSAFAAPFGSTGPVKAEDEVASVAIPATEQADARLVLDGQYAGFWMRFWAYLVDLLVIGSVQRMIVYPVFRALDVSLVEDGIFSAATIATAAVFYLYFVLMTKFYGQTIGKMIFGLKVVELDGERLSWGTVLFREWIGRFISATVVILYVVVAFTKKKQGLHDLFADTTVIIEPR